MDREPLCPFDDTVYIGVPDSKYAVQSVDIPELIRRLDETYAANDYLMADKLISDGMNVAMSAGDWRSRITLVSEQLGLFRKTMEEEKALKAVSEALKLIEEHSMGRTVSGATVLLNAATTMKCFGDAEGSIPLFEHVLSVYSDKLDPHDYRFAGLYNNMALSYEDTGEYKKAESYFHKALGLLQSLEDTNNDLAVTWCNLAELYYMMDNEDERVTECMEKAGDCLLDPELKHDGYYRFTAGKCLPMFDSFGFFYYAQRLREILEEMNGIHR